MTDETITQTTPAVDTIETTKIHDTTSTKTPVNNSEIYAAKIAAYEREIAALKTEKLSTAEKTAKMASELKEANSRFVKYINEQAMMKASKKMKAIDYDVVSNLIKYTDSELPETEAEKIEVFTKKLEVIKEKYPYLFKNEEKKTLTENNTPRYIPKEGNIVGKESLKVEPEKTGPIALDRHQLAQYIIMQAQKTYTTQEQAIKTAQKEPTKLRTPKIIY